MLQLQAAIAQLGERQTEDLKIPGSIPGLGMHVRAAAGEKTPQLHAARRLESNVQKTLEKLEAISQSYKLPVGAATNSQGIRQ